MAVISKAQAEHYLWGQHCDGWHLLRSPTLSVIEERVPPCAGESLHYHEKAQQFFYILAGVATLQVNGTEFILQVEEGMAVAAGAIHSLHNHGAEVLRFLVISTPSSHGDRIAV